MKRFYLISICALLLFSCDSGHKKNSKIYIELLSSEYDFDISDGKYCFVILPVFACGGCVSEMLS